MSATALAPARDLAQEIVHTIGDARKDLVRGVKIRRLESLLAFCRDSFLSLDNLYDAYASSVSRSDAVASALAATIEAVRHLGDRVELLLKTSQQLDMERDVGPRSRLEDLEIRRRNQLIDIMRTSERQLRAFLELSRRNIPFRGPRRISVQSRIHKIDKTATAPPRDDRSA